MVKVTVDGCEYTVDLDGRYGVDTVSVYYEVEGRVPVRLAEAEIDHNCEQVFVEYDLLDDEDEFDDATYPYFEYTTPEELAAWMVSTHPEHQ